MRIAYVITRADAVGGASIHVRDLACEMMLRGHKVRVLIGGSGPVAEQLENRGVEVRSLSHLGRPIHPWRDLLAYLEVTNALSRWKPDLVSAHTAKAGWIARAACRQLGLPAVYTPHGWAITDRVSARQGHVFTVAERIAAPWANAIVCVSESERRLAVEKQITDPERLVVIHNGVRDIPEQLRGRPEAEFNRIVSVARFEPPKDHLTLIDALSSLASHEWRLDLVGDGPLLDKVRGYVYRTGLEARVHFLGYYADPAEVLAGAQLFVLSSRSEGLPRSVLEAMRAGLPVIASDVGGVAEFDAVQLVPPGSWEALASAIYEAMSNRGLRERLGAEARAVYESRFRFEHMVEKTMALYERLTSRGRPG